MTDTGEIRTSIVDGIGYVWLSRPAKLNALSTSMWRAIPGAVADLAKRPDVRLIALRGEGGTFSTGADLRDVFDATANAAAATAFCQLVGEALTAVASASVPTVALVEGAATGGGAELALAADLRVMTTTATVRLPLAHLGVVPDRLTLRRLLGLIGPGATRLLMLTGETLSAAECLRCGLTERIVEPDDIDAAARRLARTFATAAPAAVAAIKSALNAEEGVADLAGSDGLVAQMRESFLRGHLRQRAAEFLRD